MNTYELLLITGSEQDQVYLLEDDEIIVGRDTSCQITIDDRTISRQHAKISRHGDSFAIKDLDSVNGTFVNGVQVSESDLTENDRLTLGKVDLLLRRTATLASAPDHSPSPRATPTDPPGSPHLGDQKLVDTQETELPSVMSITHSLSSGDLMNLLGRSHATLSTMHRVIRMVSSIFDLDLLLDKILEETFATIRAERAFILLIDPHTDQLEIKASRWRDKEGLDREVSISHNIISHVLEKKESVLIADAMADSQFGMAKSVVLHKIRSAMCSPLRGRTRIVGIIHVDTSTSSGDFGNEDLMLLDAIGNAAGIAVENAQLYKEKIQNERLAAMGQAISGLSHYIKNILAAMETSGDLMQRGLDSEDLGIIHRVWRILRRSNQRINNLVLDMLAYSKERKPETQLCPINDTCKEAAELCHDRIQAKDAELHLALDPKLPLIQADPQGIHRCLLNLLTNAIDAVDETGGEIRIETRTQGESEILITVGDNGGGIPPDILQRIFDVFFSTKGSQGTGLGLAVTKKIIEEHQGRIEVHSDKDQGTQFSIALPVGEQAVSGNR